MRWTDGDPYGEGASLIVHRHRRLLAPSNRPIGDQLMRWIRRSPQPDVWSTLERMLDRIDILEREVARLELARAEQDKRPGGIVPRFGQP